MGPVAHWRKLAGGHGGWRWLHGGVLAVPGHCEARRGEHRLHEGKAKA